jgi:hypothetical protein
MLISSLCNCLQMAAPSHAERAIFSFPVAVGPGNAPTAVVRVFWAILLRQTLLAGFPFVHNPVVRDLALQSRGEPVFKFKAVGLGRRTLLQLLDTLLQGGDVLILPRSRGHLNKWQQTR